MAPQKVKHKITMSPSSSTPRYILQRIEIKPRILRGTTVRPREEVIAYGLQVAAPGRAGFLYFLVCFSKLKAPDLRFYKEYLLGMSDFGPGICRKMSHY